jgi:hypothetical protein
LSVNSNIAGEIREQVMSYRATSEKAAPHSLSSVGRILSIAGLILALFAPNLVHAQHGPMDSTVPGQSAGDQYKRGETPTGQEYGIIKKGEPHKSEAATKKGDRKGSRDEMKNAPKPGTDSTSDRDKTEY